MLKTLLSLLTVFSLLLCSCGKKQLLSPVFDNNVQAEKDKSAKSSEVEEVKDEPEPKKESKGSKRTTFLLLFFCFAGGKS